MSPFIRPGTAICLVLGFSLGLTGCLGGGELDIDSQQNFEKQGLSIEAEVVPLGGISKVTVKLNYVTPRDVTFHLEAAGVDAVEGYDFQRLAGDYTIPAGQSSIGIPLISFRQNVSPADRHLTVSLSNVEGAAINSSSADLKFVAGAGATTLDNARLVMAANMVTCISGSDRRIYCWGSDLSSQASGTGAISTLNKLKTVIPNIDSDPIKLTGSHVSSCALFATGRVVCWGTNVNGNISSGIGAGGSFVPAQSILLSGQETAVDVAAGWLHTCVVFADGTMGCKGQGTSGELGHGLSSGSPNLQTVTGLGASALKVAAGFGSTCAIITGGAVKCWGDNVHGTLAKGTLGGTNNSAQVSLILSGMTQIAAGKWHYCGIGAAGAVYCWGQNANGQLGISNGLADSGTPTAVSLPRPAVQVDAAANQSCAVLDTGELYCWGANNLGQLGDQTLVDRTLPVKVLGLPDKVRSVATGDTGTCVLFQTDSRLFCWGDNSAQQANNFSSQLTFPTDLDNLVGLKVKDLSITSQSASSFTNQFACAVMENGEGNCWGYNLYANVGRAFSSYAILGQVTGLSAGLVQSIRTGTNFACALLSSAGIKCWGAARDQALGDGGSYLASDGIATPVVPVGLASGVKQIASGGFHSCALMLDGTVQCWGETDNWGESHAACYQATPTVVSGLSNIVQLEVSKIASCALNSQGQIKCWGSNPYGGFGTGAADSTCSMTVNTTASAEKFSKLAMGDNHVCAMTQHGRVFCWGSNDYGAIGQKNIQNFLTPTQVSGLALPAIDVSVGDRHSCVLLTGGGVRCWGDDTFFQLGLNRLHVATYYSPVTPLGLGAGIKSIKGSSLTTCAITAEGFVKCWGGNGGGLARLGFTIIPFPKEVYDVRTSN